LRSLRPIQAIDPHFFAVALAIQLSAQPESDYYGEELQFGSKLSFFVASEVNNAAANAALPEAFEQLMCRAEDAELGAVAEDLRDEITRIESPDALLDRLQCLADALQRDVDSDGDDKRLIDPRSVVGRFVREIVLVYNGLLFEGVARLFEAVERYAAVGPGAQPPTHSDADDDAELRARAAHLRHVPPKQLERRLAVAAEELQRFPRARGARVVEREVDDVLAAAPDLASGHLVRHINFTQHYDFAGALHSLHNYFDLPVGRESAIIDGGGGLGGLQSRGGGDATARGAGRAAPRKAFQHAVLNLAAVHHHFGHHAEALLALNEAMRVAQQREDHRCVALAGTWRLRILESQRVGRPAEVDAAFARSLDSAIELGMDDLAIVTALALARHRLATATGAARDVLRVLGTAKSMLARKKDGTSALTVSQEASLRGQLQQLLACFWEAAGHSGLAKIALRAQLQFYAAHGTTPENMLSLVKLAALKAEESAGSAGRGVVGRSSTHETCSRLLRNAQARFPDDTAARAEVLCALRQARAQGAHRRALALGRSLAIASPATTAQEWPSTTGGAKLYVELGAQRVATLSAARAWREASALARSLIRLARSHCMLRAEVDLLILWAEIALAVAPTDTSTALPAILRAVALCDRFELSALRARVACLLVRVFIDEGSIAKAKAELASVAPRVLEHSPTAVRSQLRPVRVLFVPVRLATPTISRSHPPRTRAYPRLSVSFHRWSCLLFASL
jgi:hypothetical protein